MPLAAPQEVPEISIGIPLRNGMPDLPRLLDQVFAQEIAAPFEVMVLDSGSTDGGLEVVRQYPVRLIELSQEGFDWGRLRERLHAEARGAIVVNLSQDAIPARSDWLACLVRPLADPAIAVSSGSSIPDPDRAFPQFQWEKNGYYYFTREIAKFTARYGRGISFGNTAVRRSVWADLHIDPQATGEDFGFQIKLKAAGRQMAFPEDAPVLHHHFYTLKRVFRRCRNEGLALRQMGCGYTEFDLLRDWLRLDKNLQWLREIRYGRLRNSAEWLYPVLRPWAVYWGSRFARRMLWY